MSIVTRRETRGTVDMNADQQIVDDYVDRAVEEYQNNPLATKLLHRIAERMPEQFCTSALRHLEGTETQEAYRLLATLLMRQPGLFEFIANPALGTKHRAVRIVQRIMQYDPSFDVRIARKLPDRGGLNHHEAWYGVRASRVLDVLDEVSEGRRLLPVLSHLVQSDDKKLSEKATLFVGRRVRSVSWSAKMLKGSDERMRANAVEALWGLSGEDAVRLLESCVKDPNNRVAGNALMGLLILNAPGTTGVLSAMATAKKANFRSTAAWMMGRLGRQEYVPDLNVLLKDDSAMVRGTALRALIRIRRAGEQNESPAVERMELVSADAPADLPPSGEGAAATGPEEVGTSAAG